MGCFTDAKQTPTAARVTVSTSQSNTAQGPVPCVRANLNRTILKEYVMEYISYRGIIMLWAEDTRWFLRYTKRDLL